MTTEPRRKPTRDEIVASCILEIKRGDGTPIVTRDEAKHLSAREVYDVFVERVDIDHIVPRRANGPDHHANYQPLARATDHKRKTKVDRREIDKTKRIEKSQAEFRQKLLAKSSVADNASIMDTSRKSKIASRPLAGTKASGMRKKMNGSVEKR